MRYSLTLCVALLGAQEIDTTHFGGPRNRSAVATRAESEAELREFQAIQKSQQPAQRRALAEEFLAKHPQSWLLAGVYQAAASASIELNEHARAIDEGRLSLRLAPENAPLLAVLAQIEFAMGRRAQAANDARDALLWLKLFAPPAGTKDADWKKATQPIEDSARKVIEQAGGKVREIASVAAKEHGQSLKFAGSDSCKKCHAPIYERWQKTGMASMLRPLASATLMPDFSRAIEYSGDGTRTHVRAGGGARPYFELPQRNGDWKRYRVDFVIGSKWQQAYATKLEDGRMFVFPIQYNRQSKQWTNYWATVDPPGSERADTSAFWKHSSATSYQRNCAACHTSQLRLTRLDDSTFERATFFEAGINCEMCHGPSAAHAAAPEKQPPVRFVKLDAMESTLVCGQCHRQSALRNVGPNGEMNYTSDAPYFERLLNQPYSEFGTRAFYKDGRFRETTFIGEAFQRSACFRRGSAHCGSCHNPHPEDAGPANPVSLKFRNDPDQMCVQCHIAQGAQASAHTHHAKGSAGSRCGACHMPPIMGSVGFQAGSHQIDDVPRTDFTRRFGQAESPNACLICHKDRAPQWLEAELANWKARPR
ncbi:MAG: multiheme c-type cytochrome [Bryobacteraceae bacterium]